MMILRFLVECVAAFIVMLILGAILIVALYALVAFLFALALAVLLALFT